jgi:hypothetical protein
MLEETIPHGGGNPQLSHDTTVRLDDLGVTRDQSSRWQTLARLPEAVFEEHA